MAESQRRGASAEDASGDSFLRHGGELLAAGKLVEAREALERACALTPNDARVQNLLGLACFKLGIFDRAAELYEQLVRDNPVDPTLRVNLGLVHLRLNALERATREFETAVDLAPDHKKAQNYLGLAYAQAGEYGRARDCFVAAGSASMAEKMEQALREAAAAAPAEQPAPGEPPAEPVAEQPAVVGEAPAAAIEPPREGVSLSDKIRAAARGGGAEQPKADAYGEAGEQAAVPADVAEEEDVLLEASEEYSEPMPEPAIGEQAAWPAEAEEVAGVAAPAAVESVEEEVEIEDASAAEAASQEAGAGIESIVAPPLICAEPPAGAVAGAPRLSELTRAIAIDPATAEAVFAIAPDAVRIRVDGELLTRLEGLMAAFGMLRYRPELKRFRGNPTDKPFGDGERRMVRASGQGRLVLDPGKACFASFELAGESAYFREEMVFGFEAGVDFENGRVPSKVAPDLHLVHLRGSGQVLVSAPAALHAVEVVLGAPCVVPFDVLVGWHGAVTPRILGLPEDGECAAVPAVELTGEGRALLFRPARA